MILVLSSQGFPPLILVSDRNVFSLVSTSERNEPFQNVSPYVSLKGPLVRSYDLLYTLVDVGSHNFLVFCYRLFSIFATFDSYSSQRFSPRNVFTLFSVCKWLRGYIGLAFSSFLCTLASLLACVQTSPISFHAGYTFARHCSVLPKVFSVLGTFV